ARARACQAGMSATIGGGETETFDLSGPDAPEKDGKFPSLTLRAKLKGSLEPEVRFDDTASNGFEIQCLHIPARE
ncbi:MAG: hypothetical protein K2X47_13695, partial [Bdellovibrionales bacterium]|nr:hypothetical protein [Bdellovibrionales bacterium]